MDKEILISVIVPVYNVAEYLERFLFSIEEQKFKYFEVILVDDGSTDDSGTIIDKWSQKQKIATIVIHKKNEGVSVARNVGLEHARGKYVCFIDSDDMILPGYLSDMYNAIINSSDNDIVICKKKSIADTFSVEDYKKNVEYNSENILSKNKSIEIMKKLLYKIYCVFGERALFISR